MRTISYNSTIRSGDVIRLVCLGITDAWLVIAPEQSSAEVLLVQLPEDIRISLESVLSAAEHSQTMWLRRTRLAREADRVCSLDQHATRCVQKKLFQRFRTEASVPPPAADDPEFLLWERRVSRAVNSLAQLT